MNELIEYHKDHCGLYDNFTTVKKCTCGLEKLMVAERLKVYNDLYPISDHPGISEYIMERIVELTHQAQAGGEDAITKEESHE